MTITAEEYRARIERLAVLAGDAGLDGVLLTAESNIDYFSGYRHHAPWTLFAMQTWHDASPMRVRADEITVRRYEPARVSCREVRSRWRPVRRTVRA